MQRYINGAPAGRRRGFRLTLAAREQLAGYGFISPWVIGFVLFTAGPLLASLLISFTDWDLIGSASFVGLHNYDAMLHDRLVWQSLRVTATYAAGRVPAGIVLGIVIALLLNQRVRLIGFWRVLYYLPVVLPPVAVSMVWMWIYQPSYGLLNGLLALVGVRGPAWLGSDIWVIPALIIAGTWTSAGRYLIVYLAGLNAISKELYEAAEIDGASLLQRFFRVTLPMLTPTIFFNLVTGLIDSFKVFTQPYVMTQGGPDHNSLFFALYLYQNAFNRFQMGYASALAWVFVIVVMAFTLLVFRTARAWVYYESAEGVV